MGYNNQPTTTATTGELLDHAAADALLQGRNRKSRKLANNTYLLRHEDGSITVRLHDTDIVTINTDGSYTLNSGGWLTVTTKDRINRYAPGGISQRAGVWYLADGSLFYDGVTVDGSGNPRDPRQPGKYEDQLKEIKKQARQYAKDFGAAIRAGAVGYPSGGDCWYCALQTDNKQPLGDATDNHGHLRSHIEDGYFVPSLLVNAAREAGYSDIQAGMMGMGGQRVFIDPENNIYKYIVKRLQKEIK